MDLDGCDGKVRKKDRKDPTGRFSDFRFFVFVSPLRAYVLGPG